MDEAKARGPYAKTAARRAEIIRAARDHFAEHGYAGASLRGIAERAGISHAGLLRHFHGKDELLTAVLAQRDAEEWTEGLAEVKGTASLAPFLAGLLQHHQKAPELMRLWLELAAAASRPDHPAHAYFVERYDRGRTRVADGMRKNSDREGLRNDLAPDSAAVLFQAVLNGLQLQWLLNPQLDIIEPLTRFLELICPPDENV
ncbi:TetR/AcrR family transcriptional regulator [Streptomyces sp. NPDC060006]|uniref:TetR/AcrR family transcriptional regulator n=1 Tax=unclassified Streptomyces TaxID=2593676 RepID=UPI0036C4DA7D